MRHEQPALPDASHHASYGTARGCAYLRADCRNATLERGRGMGGLQIFTIGNDDLNPVCAVERVVDKTVHSAFEEAARILLGRVGAVSLADLAADFYASCRVEGWGNEEHPWEHR